MELAFSCLSSKFPPESADGTGVDRLVDPYHAGTADLHRSAILTLNLQMFVLPVTYDTLSFFLFRGFSTPAGDDGKVAPVVNGMSAMLI